jgi:hypothetical protein
VNRPDRPVLLYPDPRPDHLGALTRAPADALFGVDPRHQAGGAVDGDQPAVVDQGHPVGEPFRLLHEVGDQDHGDAPVSDLLDQLPGVAAAPMPPRSPTTCDWPPAGITRVVLVDLHHHALDDTHVLARTDWRGERTTASTPVQLSSTFILRRDADRLRVVFYLNHQDLARALSVA